MIDRRQFGTEAGFGGWAGDILHEAGGRAGHVAVQDGFGRQLDRLAEAFQRHRIGHEAACGRIGQRLVSLEVDAERAKIVTA